jgi:hypothetical protein
MIFSRTVKIADREVREQLRLFRAKKEESEKFMAKINASIAEMSVVLANEAKVKEQLLRQLNDIEAKSQSTTTAEPTVTAVAPCITVPEKEQQKEQEPDKQMELPTQKESGKRIIATEREVELDHHHIVMLSPIPTAEDRKKTGSEITKLEWYMQSNYILRYNEVTGQTEYKHRGSNEPFRKVTDRVIYAMCTEARKSGVNVWDNDIKRHTYSSHIEVFHPMKGYIESLPKWDGKDRVTPLAERVSESEFWVKHFHTWMCGLTAQWLGKDKLHGNSVAPILISKRQGRQKSTFCKLLLPDELQPYYLDRLNINSTSRAEEKLTEFALINLDEIDKYSAKDMASLKNLMQMATVNTKKAYQQGLSELPRTASFIAISNRRDLLTDPIGSRRFICIEVDKKIDCSPIDHAQIYAQLKEEIEQGKRYWFEEDEETEIMAHNAAYQRNTIEEDVFDTLFRKPIGNEKTIKLSALEIYDEMKAADKEAMKGVKESSKVWSLLKELDYHKEHYEDGNKYSVMRR